MDVMLNIAGGVVIGGIILGLLWIGLTLLLSPDEPLASGEPQALGGLLMLVGGAAAFWLLFIHTGIVSPSKFDVAVVRIRTAPRSGAAFSLPRTESQ